MKFENLSNNLNWLMAEERLNSNELARRTGIPASSIKKIRNNDNPNPTLTTLAPLASFFSITVSQLIGDTPLSNDKSNKTEALHNHTPHQIPIISWEDSINWPSKSEQEYPLIAVERPYSQNSFCLLIEEESCKCFPKGTLLLIDPNIALQHLDYGLLIKEDQNKPTLKQIIIEEKMIFLKSLIIESHIIQKTNEYKILGTVVEQRNYFR
ncbi:MAG: helix-turn-helix domain-containing protein [Gammaproteobacteria bacterium]